MIVVHLRDRMVVVDGVGRAVSVDTTKYGDMIAMTYDGETLTTQYVNRVEFNNDATILNPFIKAWEDAKPIVPPPPPLPPPVTNAQATLEEIQRKQREEFERARKPINPDQL